MSDDQLINKKFHTLQRDKIVKDHEKFIYNEIGNRIIHSLEGIKFSIENCLEIGPSSNAIYSAILSKFNQIEYYNIDISKKILEKSLAKDHSISLDDVNVIAKTHPGVVVNTYDADHGFHCDMRGSFNPRAASIAGMRTIRLFDNM